MKKAIILNIGKILTVMLFFITVCYFLLSSDLISINSIIDHSHSLQNKTHLLILALLPIYISLMVFGAAILGLAMGAPIQNFLSRK